MKLILLTFLFTSCTYFSTEKNLYPFIDQVEIQENDYSKHLESVANRFVKESGNIVKYNGSRSNYIIQLYNRIKSNNENLFKRNIRPTFYVIKDKRNFFFSAPAGKFFYSSGILNNYLKNEDIFIASFAIEMIRTEYNIYKKNLIIPMGKSKIKNIVKLTYLELDERKKINNLTFEIMKRSGFDPEALLLWLQILNRNTIDFSLQYENTNIIPKEEYYLKNYMIKINTSNNIKFEKNSSRDFYRFKKEVSL